MEEGRAAEGLGRLRASQDTVAGVGPHQYISDLLLFSQSWKKGRWGGRYGHICRKKKD